MQSTDTRALDPELLFHQHLPRFERVRQACRQRGAWSAFPDQLSGYPDSEAALAAGKRAFEAALGCDWDSGHPCDAQWLGEEVSPYTQQPLGIRYRAADLDAQFSAAQAGMEAWASASIEARAGVLLEVVERLYRDRLCELVHAVMHTTGQSQAMSYAGSGVNALDRALEALSYALDAMQAVTPRASWARRFGSAEIRLEKRYRLMPRGVAVCFSCASFPTWNAWPSMIASLATGNAVLVKPHPATVLPMAISVQVFRAVLAAAGFDPNLVQLAIDSVAAPIGKQIIEHPGCAIVDFTGSARFGQWVERHAHPALCFTETAGCNTVVIESCEDLDAVVRSLATTLCLFSAQMCTSPQNIYVPQSGIRVGTGAAASVVSPDEFCRALAAAVDAIGADPRKAAAILATIQSPATLALLEQLQAEGERRATLLLAPRRYPHPEFPAARTSTPLMLGVTPRERDLYAEERFGPISFVIRVEDPTAALAEASRDVRECGGLTAFLYSTDPQFVAAGERAFAHAGAQLTINLTGPMPLNFAAAYSDYHVTGLNPAGNASLTDLAFVAGRFRIAQSRQPVSS